NRRSSRRHKTAILVSQGHSSDASQRIWRVSLRDRLRSEQAALDQIADCIFINSGHSKVPPWTHDLGQPLQLPLEALLVILPRLSKQRRLLPTFLGQRYCRVLPEPEALLLGQ